MSSSDTFSSSELTVSVTSTPEGAVIVTVNVSPGAGFVVETARSKSSSEYSGAANAALGARTSSAAAKSPAIARRSIGKSPNGSSGPQVCDRSRQGYRLVSTCQRGRGKPLIPWAGCHPEFRILVESGAGGDVDLRRHRL